MKPEIKIIGEAWFWQIGKILKGRKQLGGFLGRYNYSFKRNTLIKAEIELFKVKPLFWKKLLNHEMGHHEITLKANSFEEAVRLNEEYDKKTCHGICQGW